MNEKEEKMYPEIYSTEFVVNIENVRLTFITQETKQQNYKIPSGVVMHFHACYEMFLCEKGEVYVNVEDRKISFKEGEALIVPPGVSHAISGYAPGSTPDSVYFSISSNGQKSSLDLYKIVSKIIGDSCSVLPGMSDLGIIMRAIRRAGEEKNYYQISNLAHSFLMKLVELTGNIPRIHEGTRSDNSNLRVHKIHVFIHNHLGEEVSLEELATILRLSTRQVGRIVKENFGCSFKELVTKLRMEKAGELMRRKELRVSEVSSMVGYSSERGFYTAFKNHFGCLPKEYRKNIQ